MTQAKESKERVQQAPHSYLSDTIGPLSGAVVHLAGIQDRVGARVLLIGLFR